MSEQQLEVIPPPPMVWDREEALREQKFLPALEGLVAGETIEVAAKRAHTSRAGLLRALARSPRLKAEMVSMRHTLRELAYLKAVQMAHDRLQNGKDMTNRDLTDMLRSLKPPTEATNTNVTITLDV